MNGELEPNPYAAPEAPVVRRARPLERLHLAGRGERLLAALLDGLIYLPCVFPLFMGNAMEFLTDAETLEPDGLGAVGLLLALAVWALILGFQVYLLHQNGWTLGKRVLRIRIVDLSGANAGLARLVLVRMLVPNLLAGCCNLFWLVDLLLIFGQSRRCLHDLMAGTVVVRA